jgi:hypothetical protein
MDEIIFDAAFGNVTKKVNISQPFGTGGDQYHLTIEGFYKGSMWKLEDKWIFYGNAGNELTSDDIQALGERIDQSK